MIFTETKLKGSYIIQPDPIWDERGFFARTFCAEEFRERGLVSIFVQHNVSYNTKKGTLRGMHFQAAPHEEIKLVTCTRGAVYDVIVDLRPDSSTFRQWLAVELSQQNRRTLYVPVGFAHGFETLDDDTELLYHISQQYYQESARGVRWNDPAFGIEWPLEPTVMSVRDMEHPDFHP
jgi:dTDP-4-dehydrorhamnose 3,5-epimerase